MTRLKITNILFVFSLFGITSCQSDNFNDVTKSIKAPEVIEVDNPFKFQLLLTNTTTKPLSLTLDKEITKSVQFTPHWYCGEQYLLDKTPNPGKETHEYYSVELKPEETLIFELGAVIRTFSDGDSLELVIDNHEKNFKLAYPDCDNFNIHLGGMWLPGNGSFGDSMEGYSFGTKIEIKKPLND